MERFTFLTVALLVAFNLIGAYAGCPWITMKAPFDEARFAGDWKIVASKYNPKAAVKKCANLTIAPMNGDLGHGYYDYKVDFFVSDNVDKVETGNATNYLDQDFSVIYTVYKKHDTEKLSHVYKKAVVATDYDNYAVTVSCRPTFDPETKTFGRDLHATIYARSKTLPEDTVHTLKSLITTYDVDYDSIKMLDHNC